MTLSQETAAPAIVAPQVLLSIHLKALKLPTFAREYEKVAMESAQDRADYPRYLLRLCAEKFRNDRGVPEICIGVKEFMCIGESPPQDHPHVYINMGEADTILCPYCATRYRFDPRLTPLDADPPDSFFTDHNAV